MFKYNHDIMSLHSFDICFSSQSLHAMEGHVMVNFLPTVLNQLFCVLTRATHEDVAVNVTRQAKHTQMPLQKEMPRSHVGSRPHA